MLGLLLSRLLQQAGQQHGHGLALMRKRIKGGPVARPSNPFAGRGWPSNPLAGRGWPSNPLAGRGWPLNPLLPTMGQLSSLINPTLKALAPVLVVLRPGAPRQTLPLSERGRIRTYVETSTDLQSAAFNHSATLPLGLCLALLVSNLGFAPFLARLAAVTLAAASVTAAAGRLCSCAEAHQGGSMATPGLRGGPRCKAIKPFRRVWFGMQVTPLEPQTVGSLLPALFL